jgi:hypothetical protein
MERLLRESRFAETWKNSNPKYFIEESFHGNVRTYYLSHDGYSSTVARAEVNKDGELCALNVICNYVEGAEQFINDFEVEPYTYNLNITHVSQLLFTLKITLTSKMNSYQCVSHINPLQKILTLNTMT